MKVEEQFLTKSKFTKLIEGTVADMKIPYMDAILHVCKKNDIEPEDVRKFVSPVIKDKLEAEAMDLNFLPKKNSIDSSLFEQCIYITIQKNTTVNISVNKETILCHLKH